MPRSRPPRAPQLLRASEAADLLNVTPATIRNWINEDKVPYVRLPNNEPRIPLPALLASLRGNYDLAGAMYGGAAAEAGAPSSSTTGEFEAVG